MFKTLVSGEPVLGKKLYSDLRTVTNYAKLMFNMNSLPDIKFESKAFKKITDIEVRQLRNIDPIYILKSLSMN